MKARCRTLRGAITLGIATLMSLALVAPAHAEDEISIDHVEVVHDRVSMVLGVDGIRPPVSVDPASVVVEVDGRSVRANAKVVAAGDIDRSTVLVLDASNSMRQGGKFAAATAAVNAFLDSAPPDVEIGLVTFAGDVEQAIAPTTDHETIRKALAGVELGKGTGLYDALLEGVALAGDTGSRSILLLSDGGDTSSVTTLEVAAGEAALSEIVVDVVSLGDSANATSLTGLADNTGGEVIESDLAALIAVFTRQADALADQLLVTFVAPRVSDGDASINVSLDAKGTTYADSAVVSIASTGGDTPDVVDRGKALVGKPVMLVGAVTLFVGLLLVLGMLLGGIGGRSSADRRLEAYFDGGTGGGHKAQGRGTGSGSADLKGSAVAITDKMVNADLETRVGDRLAGAGSSLTVAEWLLLHAGIAVGAGLAGLLLIGGALGILGGLVLGVVLPWLYLKRRHSKRHSAFNAQLAESLTLLAGGLSAGLSLPQAIDTVVREAGEPMASELRRALVEQRLGVPLEDALDALGERMSSEDFLWVVMAIRIQREVGGNLAELMNTVSDTLREREYLRRQVKVLSAEGRFSAYVLAALPVCMFIYMLVVRREFIGPMFQTAGGLLLLGVAAGMLLMGIFVLSRIVKIEV